MNLIRSAIFVLLLPLITAPLGAAVAQSDGADVLQEIAACRAIEKKKARLKCYDRAAGALAPQASEASSSAPVAREAPATAFYDEVEVDPEAAFGAEQLIERNREEEREKIKDLQALAAKITKNRAGKYVVELENGQVWRQIPADTNQLRLVGDAENRDVIIKKRLLGYALRLGNSKRTILVRRIK